jgi:hypothetical protein
MTADQFKQEYEAEFTDDVGTVFSDLEASIASSILTRGRPGARYVTGIDLGQRVNYTVLCSLSVGERRLEGFARFNHLDWSIQEQRILEHLRAFPGPAVVDATGGGQPIYERLRDAHREHIERFVFTAQTRDALLSALQLAFNHRRLPLARVPELLNELRAFTQVSVRSPQGLRTRLAAPAGLHDDCVMALALAWWGLESRSLWSIGASGNPLRNGVFA